MRISDWSSDVCSSDLVEVQCQVAAGVPGFVVVGLPDKAVAESRERVRAAISAIGLSLPPKRITVNLSRSEAHTSELQSLMRTSYAVFCLTKKSNCRLKGEFAPTWI